MRCNYCKTWLGQAVVASRGVVITMCWECADKDIYSTVPVRVRLQPVPEPEDEWRRRMRLEERPWRP